MKKLFSFIICSALVCNFFSCKNEEEDIWNKSSAERLEDAKEEYNDFLSDSPNGWVMEYFPTTSSKGYIYLMDFHKDGSVKIGGKNEWINNEYKDSTSIWEIIGDNGPVLTLNTYNPVFHIFASPDPGFPSLNSGKGLEGDYEFIILQPEKDNELTIKGKKRSTYIHLTKLAEGQDWRAYFNQIDQVNNDLFKDVPNGMYLVINDEEKYTLYDGSKGIFKSVPEGGDNVLDAVSKPFVVTNTGLKFYEPFEEKKGVEYFVLNAEKSRLTCTENDQIYMVHEPVVNFFLRMQHGDDTRRWNFLSDNMSPQMKSIYDRMVVSCSEKGLKLTQMACNYLEERNSFEVYIVASRGSQRLTCYYDFDYQDKGDDVMACSFKGTFNNNGGVFYETDGFKEMMQLLSTSFKVASDCEVPLNLAKIKLTSTDNPDIWFTLGL